MTMTRVMTWIRVNWKSVSIIVIIGVACAALGHLVKPRVVTKTVFQDREVVKYQDRVVTVEKPVVKWLTRTVTKTVYIPGTTTPASTTVTTTNAGSQSQGSETTATAAGTTMKQDSGATTSTSGPSEGRWSVQALVGASTYGGWTVGAAAQYRLLGPVTLGVWTTTTLGAPTLAAGASVGLRL